MRTPTPPPPPAVMEVAFTKLGQQLEEAAPALVRDVLLAAIKDKRSAALTCGDCIRAYRRSESDNYGRCGALPPVTVVVENKPMTRDPIVNWDRPACVLFAPS